MTRIDLHVHSTASQQSRLGVQRALGLPECATPPEEVYALAKARGMDFVTLTDHDTIDGALMLAGRPDVFVSEELTAWFRGEPQAVHVLCLGITPDDHARLHERAGDVERVAEYLREGEIACALAHPFYAVRAPLHSRHRRRLAQLFGVWEIRNGLARPRAQRAGRVDVETHGGIGIGGSDDHAGATSAARTPRRRGRGPVETFRATCARGWPPRAASRAARRAGRTARWRSRPRARARRRAGP